MGLLEDALKLANIALTIRSDYQCTLSFTYDIRNLKKPRTLFVVADEHQLAKSLLETVKDREIIADLDLTGFVKNDCLNWDYAGDSPQSVR